LLSAMCDCTVNLDSDLCIAKPCLKLAGLLLRSSNGSANVTKPFLDLLTPDDRPRFTSYIEEGILAQRLSNLHEVPAHPLHLSLLDVNHSLVPVEVFSSFIEDAEGSSVHLVGIKQEELYQQGENAHLASSHCDSKSVPENSMRISLDNLRHSQGSEIQCISENSVCSSSDVASGLSSCSVADIDCKCSLAMMRGSHLARNIPIIDYTVGFSMLLGPSSMKGMNFFELMAKDSTEAFQIFLKNRANNWAIDAEDDAGQRCPVWLDPPWLRSRQIYIRAEVTVTFEYDDLNEEDMGIFPESFLATFDSVTWHQGHKRSRINRKRMSRRVNTRVTQSPDKPTLLQL